ncbi:MAG: CotH kinase family protein [Muribaculaceae bacterium]|nr:CotH kinase family protein [Muribaculaceae bacterium]
MKRFVVLLAIVVLAGLLPSSAVLLSSPINKNVKLKSTNLPIVWLTADGTMNHDERITARMKIIDNGTGQLNYTDTIAHPGQHVDYDGYIAIRYRGNSSYTHSMKKPYSFRPLDKPLEEGGSWKKVPMLGMPKDNNWALLAPFSDRSMIRDMLAFEISRPWMEYTPQGRYCEVIYNNIYYGVYILTEVVSKGKNRLNLDDPGQEGDELTGGYIMEVDRDDEPNYVSKYPPLTSTGQGIYTSNIHFQYKFPDYEDLTDEQLTYIHKQIDKMETAFITGFRNKTTGECKYIDETSFIDFQLAMEIGHNIDAYRLSGKFFKRRDSQDSHFKMVVWDMNLAYGNCNYHDGWLTDTWMYQVNDILPKKPTTDMVPLWWYYLNKDTLYIQHLKQRWSQYRQSNLRIDNLMATIDSLATMLTSNGAESRNTMAYPLWGTYIWPNYYIATDYNDEIAFLKQWITDRIVWMDRQLDYRPPHLPGDINEDGEVTIADVNKLIEMILLGTIDLDDIPQADLDGDGEVGIADISYLIYCILSNG